MSFSDPRILHSLFAFKIISNINFFEALEERAVDYKILSSVSKKSAYIFENMDNTKIKELCPTVKDNLCFLIKDDDKVLFFIKKFYRKQ